MQMRKLGNQGLMVSEMGLGCIGMSEFYGSFDDRESIATVHHAIDLGINFLDTADMYGPFTNEQLVGKAIHDRRDQVIVATKFGNARTSDGQFLDVSGKPDYVRSACDASLQRLGIDTIDLYYQHRVDPTIPIEETIGAMAELVSKARFAILVYQKQLQLQFDEHKQFIQSAHCKQNTRYGAAIQRMRFFPQCANWESALLPTVR